MHGPAVHDDFPAVQVELQSADAEHRLAEALAAPNDGLHPGQKLGLVERLGDEIVGAHAETLHLGLRPRQSRQDQNRRFDPREAHSSHNLIAFHIRQHEIEHHDIVIIVPYQFEGLFPGIGLIHHGAA